jgi:phage FluMu protein Com
LFTREPWRTYLLVLVRHFDDLTTAGAVGNLIAFLPDLDTEAAAQVVHAIVVQGHMADLTPEILRTEPTRAAFLAHPEDIKSLTAAQMLALIPPADSLRRPTKEGGVGLQMLQPTFHSVVVPSLRFKEGKLSVFNCTHILNPNEMLAGISEVEAKCEARRCPATGKLLADTYKGTTMHAQCPKCMAQRLTTYFDEH